MFVILKLSCRLFERVISKTFPYSSFVSNGIVLGCRHTLVAIDLHRIKALTSLVPITCTTYCLFSGIGALLCHHPYCLPSQSQTLFGTRCWSALGSRVFPSPSHNVTGKVYAIFSRTLMFGYKNVSHFLIAKGVKDIPISQFLKVPLIGIGLSTAHTSFHDNSGYGRSSLIVSNGCFEVDILRAEITQSEGKQRYMATIAKVNNGWYPWWWCMVQFDLLPWPPGHTPSDLQFSSFLVVYSPPPPPPSNASRQFPTPSSWSTSYKFLGGISFWEQ